MIPKILMNERCHNFLSKFYSTLKYFNFNIWYFIGIFKLTGRDIDINWDEVGVLADNIATPEKESIGKALENLSKANLSIDNSADVNSEDPAADAVNKDEDPGDGELLNGNPNGRNIDAMSESVRLRK